MANWDSEIDEVARRMTEGEPGAGFRAQVLDRIEKTGATRWRLRIVWAWPAVAGIAVLALMIARPAWKADEIRLTPDAQDNASSRDRSAAGGSLADAAGQGRRGGVETNKADASAATAETSRAGSPEKAPGSASVPQTGSLASAGFNRSVSGVSGTARARPAASGPRDAAGKTTDVTARADGLVSLAPALIDIEPLSAAAMETPETIQVPGLDIAPLGVPRLAIARLEVPAMGDE